MKRTLLVSLIIIVSTALCLSQSGKIYVSQWGFTAQTIDESKYLKVTEVIQGSLAQLSGLRTSDNIVQINGQNVEKAADPASLLNKYSGEFLNLKVNRLSKSFDFKIPLIKNENKTTEYLTEGVFYYKLVEGDGIPYLRGSDVKLSLLSDDTRDMFRYKTYDFEYTSEENPLLEKKIFEELGNQLNSLGLSRSGENPDLIILLNYYSGNTEKYTPPQQIISARIEKSYNWYWGPLQTPVIESKTVKGYTTVSYLLSLTVRFLDAHELKNSKLPPVVWQGSMSKTSSDELLIIDECSKIFELLLCEYPRVSIMTPQRFIDFSYAYTGIVYDKNDILTIYDVIPDSPAAKAGLLKGDVLLTINGAKIPSKYTTVRKWEYLNGIQNGYKANIEYADKAGDGFRYLIWKHDFKDQALVFNIKRGKEKMNFELLPLEKRLIGIYQ